MKNLAFALTFVGAVIASLAVAPGAVFGAVSASSPVQAMTVAAIPNPSPNIGSRPGVGAEGPPPPAALIPDDAIPLIGFRSAEQRESVSDSGHITTGQTSAMAAVFGTSQIPATISLSRDAGGATTLIGPADQYVRFDYTVWLKTPAAGSPVGDAGRYNLVLVQQPSTGLLCWVMDPAAFTYRPISDIASSEPGTITQRDGGTAEFIVTRYPVNSGYCRP